MSRDQWAAIQHGDESYAGSPSWFAFLEAVQELFLFRHVIPTHQAAQPRRSCSASSAARVAWSQQHPFRHDPGQRRVHRRRGGRPRDPGGRDPSNEHPFKGNMDVEALERLLAERGADVPVVFVTVTNNSGGGQPVSLENLRAVRAPVIATACPSSSTPADSPRTPGSSSSEPGQEDRSIPDIVREMASLADGMTMSAKKDGLANIGGWLALNDDALAEQCRNLLILTEGFPTYGGGRPRPRGDRAGAPRGRRRGLPPIPRPFDGGTSARRSIGRRAGVKPFGHAVYLDARALLPTFRRSSIPARRSPSRCTARAASGAARSEP